MGYCTNCGASNASGNSFCWKCGGALAAESGAGEAPAEISPEAQPVRPIRPEPQPSYVAQPAPTYAKATAPYNGLSTAGMVLGIVSLVLFWFPYITIVTSVIGLIFSVRSRAQRYRFSGGGLAMNIIGLVLAVIFLTIAIAACTNAIEGGFYSYYY